MSSRMTQMKSYSKLKTVTVILVFYKTLVNLVLQHQQGFSFNVNVTLQM
jgi:hypothetical protein